MERVLADDLSEMRSSSSRDGDSNAVVSVLGSRVALFRFLSADVLNGRQLGSDRCEKNGSIISLSFSVIDMKNDFARVT